MHDNGTVRLGRIFAGGHWLAAWLALVAAAVPVAASFALADSTPQQALGYVDPSIADKKAQLGLQQQSMDIVHQMDGTVTAKPSVSYGDVTSNATPPGWSTGLSVNTNIGYSYDRQAIVSDLYNVERTRSDIARTLRRGVFNALYVQAQWLQTQEAVKQVQGQVASASNDVANVEAQVGAGKATQLDMQRSKLRLQNLQLRLEQYQQQLDSLGQQLSGYGLSAPVTFEPLQFVLPEADVTQTSAYKLKLLSVERNKANLTQNEIYDTFQYLELSGTYATGNVSVNTNLGIIYTHPRAEVNVNYPGGSDRWSVGVSATIVLSSNLANIPEWQQRIDQSQHDLTSYQSDFKTEAARRLANARFAERGLALGEQQVSLSKQALTSAQNDVDKLRQALQNPTQQDKADLQKQMQQALRNLQRAQSDMDGANRSLYGSWSNYIRNVYSYLDYVDAPWQVKAQ